MDGIKSCTSLHVMYRSPTTAIVFRKGFKVIGCNVQVHTSEFGGCGPFFLVLSMLQESSSKAMLRVKVECLQHVTYKVFCNCWCESGYM